MRALFSRKKFLQPSNSDDCKNINEATIDQEGRILGLEDPDDPRMKDDPAIFGKRHRRISLLPGRKANESDEVARAAEKKLVISAGNPFVSPTVYGGSFLDKATTSGLGEPLNIILSALSSPEVLTRKGLQGYLRSLDLDLECLNLHSGGKQQAWLDPRGYVDQAFEYREVFTPLDYVFGTCIESLRGGNHIRAWQQMGTGAWFLAASKEENVLQHHMIVPNGYDVGRDWVVEQSQKNRGKTHFMFKAYQTNVQFLSGQMPAGSAGINHDIATDGRIALLTVTLIGANKEAMVASKGKDAEKVSSLGAHPASSKSGHASDESAEKRTPLIAQRIQNLADKLQKRLASPV